MTLRSALNSQFAGVLRIMLTLAADDETGVVLRHGITDSNAGQDIPSDDDSRWIPRRANGGVRVFAHPVKTRKPKYDGDRL